MQIERDDIYDQLKEQIPYLKRHECVERVMSTTNQLLDRLVVIQHVEALEILESDEVGYGL